MKFLNHNLFTGDITVNGTTTLSTATGITRTTGDSSTHLATTAFVKAQDYATNTALGNYVPLSRTLTINNVTYDLSANRSWTIGTSDYTSVVKHAVKAGVAITKGQAIYVTSADGTNMIVGLASNTSEATSSKTMGLAETTVAINGFTNVVTEGLLAGLNTVGANAGDPVWLGTGGNLIYGLLNKPYAPAHLVFIGIVTRVNANNGEIFVKVQNGFELKEIHDVDLITTAPINGHLLGYNGTLWVNKTIAGWLGYTPANASGTTNYLSKFTGTTTLGNSQIFDNGTNVGIGTTDPTSQMSGTSGIGIYNALYPAVGFKNSTTAWLWYGQGSTFKMWNVTFGDILTANTSGNIGIGTTSPSQKLHLYGSGNQLMFIENAGTYHMYVGLSSNIGIIGSSNATPLSLQTNGGSRVYIDTSGNVGIGTTAPTEILNISRVSTNNYIKVEAGGQAANYSGLMLTEYGINWGWALRHNAATDLLHISYQDNTPTFSDTVTFNRNGNVGIGTTNPLGITNNSGLQIDRGGHTTIMIGNGTTTGGVVQSSDDTRRVFIGANIYDDISGSWSQFDGNAGYAAFDVIGDASYGLSRILVGSPGDSGYGTSNIFFEAYKSDATSYVKIRTATDNVIYLTNGGNVGIGTTSPANKLQVANGDMSITSGYSFILADTDTNWRLGRNIISPVESVYLNSSTFEFVAANASDQGWQFINDDGYPVLEIGAATGSRNVWVNAGNLLVPTGSVGIGTASPATPLHVTGGASGSGGWNRTATLAATYPALIFNSNGTKWGGMAYDYSAAMRFWVNANNDDIFAGTLAMSILNNGNVGIGTSSPGTKLDVNGVITATGGTSTQWNTAYGWGNHAGLYLGINSKAADSELLDGLDSTNFMRSYGMLNNTDVYVNFRVIQNNNSSSANDGLYIGYNNSNSGITRIFGGGATSGGLVVSGAGVNDVSIAGNTVWNSGNDGASSGLDADLLDGYQSSTSSTANTIALRDSYGDISAREFVLTASTIHTTTPSSIVGIFPTTNQVVKFADTAVRTFLNVPTRTGGDASGTWGISITGNADSATNLIGLGSIQSTSTGTSYQNNYQVRENSGGGSNTNEIYAPQLAFHWSGVVASSIMMEASGRIAIRNNPGGSYENFAAAVITATGGNSTNWNTAYGWGNHASAGYLTSYTETDTLATVTARGSSTNGSIFINGVFTGGLGAVTTSGTLDWNDVSNARAGQGYTLLLGTATNGMGGGQYYHPVSFEYSSKNGSGNMTQLAIPYTGNGIWYRNRYVGSWSSWARVWDDSSFTSTNISNWNTAYGWGNHASQGYATQTYVNTAIANLVDSAPATLDTLNELAAALGDDPNFATTVTNSIAAKLPLAGGTMSGTISFINNLGTALQGTIGDNDFWRIHANSTSSNAGFLEIATSDDGTEPIYVRQYTGVFSSLTRTATLLDGSGNTSLPGSLTVGGTITENSSIRYKENVVDLESATEKVEQLRAIRYNKIGHELEEIGLIAEEVAEVYPEVVNYNEEGQPDGVNYTRLSVILLKAVQELTERINKLESK